MNPLIRKINNKHMSVWLWDFGLEELNGNDKEPNEVVHRMDWRLLVTKYDLIDQKVYTSRLKIEAKGVHLLLK